MSDDGVIPLDAAVGMASPIIDVGHDAAVKATNLTIDGTKKLVGGPIAAAGYAAKYVAKAAGVKPQAFIIPVAGGGLLYLGIAHGVISLPSAVTTTLGVVAAVGTTAAIGAAMVAVAAVAIQHYRNTHPGAGKLRSSSAELAQSNGPSAAPTPARSSEAGLAPEQGIGLEKSMGKE